MRLFLRFVIVLCLIGCGKASETSRSVSSPITGVWVEALLKLDTLDFSPRNNALDNGTLKDPIVLFQSKPFRDSAINRDFVVNLSTWYSYYLSDNRMFLRSFTSSSAVYAPSVFEMSADKKSFTIERFFMRNELPNFIRFERLR